jgi:uncharacterized lipoprotein YmbA
MTLKLILCLGACQSPKPQYYILYYENYYQIPEKRNQAAKLFNLKGLEDISRANRLEDS